MAPACAKACPTDSIKFGDPEELRETARVRVRTLHQVGMKEAYLYGADAASHLGSRPCAAGATTHQSPDRGEGQTSRGALRPGAPTSATRSPKPSANPSGVSRTATSGTRPVSTKCTGGSWRSPAATPSPTAPNRPALEELIQYAFEQRILPRRLAVEELFPPNTHDLLG